MAPRTRAKHRRNSTTTFHPSGEAPSNDVRLSSNSDNLKGNHESKGMSHAADEPQSEEMETPAPHLYASVLGEEMLVPQTYDPNTYDPNGRMPWTPKPEPYSPETYAAWDRKHFGEEWYNLRKTMLEERNIYLEHDPVYKERQRTLRIMEHKVEMRPLKPQSVFNEGWKRFNPASPTPSKDNDDSDTDLSGYNTYPLTPEEALIDGARSQSENELGDRQARKKREAMESFRYVDPARFSLEQRHFQDHIDLPKKGWTREEIVAKYEVDVALHEWQRNNPPPRGSSDFGEAVTPEEEAASASWRQEFDNAWVCFYGSHTPKLPEHTKGYGVMELWRKGTHTRVSRQQQREALLSDATGDASSRIEAAAAASNSTSTSERRSYKTRSASPSDRRRRPPERDMPEKLRDNTRTPPQHQRRQCKTYKKERSSRRQAGEAPGYGMLGGETRTSLRQLLNTRRTSSSGPSSGRLSKKPTAAGNVKLQGIVKSRQTGTGYPKRPAKGSKG
ncbi:hypothetical protein B0T26DRAFT_744314 [Lasiosphaeria miniovina]|uniref:Uncharacterized protein n=1 Tax=Lasiosphaeria miniovina TaxID=1954250 RepID=A0AA39ZTZ5_9PEZI|nr:uncharacterized protein B0T26DRAFT_744314 [Lasiosphaeria miniovina]KAK0703515.1 hypothetical protein B0T26DRAFT_744314 [Lasiosphaeria miniovina]